MPITYVNRKDQTYYLHQGTTKTGKPKYYFSMKAEGNLAASIPAGYEIYENPDARVFLRKQRPKLIKDVEIAIVERAVRKGSEVEYFLVDVKKDAIIVLVAVQDVDVLQGLVSYMEPSRRASAEQEILRSITYSPELRFVLEDREKRVFITERYCYFGSVDDWIEIGTPGKLEKLAKKYIRHLGKDSLYGLY